jgi:hypothetical protein
MKHPYRPASALGLLLASLVLVGCATQTPVAAPDARNKASSAPASTASSATTPKARADFPGYVRTQRLNETVYCQKRNPTGSRARVAELCYTAEQMRLMEENNREYWKQAGVTSSHDTFKMSPPR